jgi:CubicO group peptidase (beta-lactamase class C family)/peroxiredoxin
MKLSIRLVFFVLSSVAAAADQPSQDGRAENIGAKADAIVSAAAQGGFRGVVLLAHKDDILWSHGYGTSDRQEKTPMAESAVFCIGSISKPFTAFGILKLEQSHKLSLGDRLDKYLAGVPEDKRAITIQQLLTHTSGLGHNYSADGITDRDAAVTALLRPALKCRPGERFSYSDDGYSLLAIILEQVAGVPFDQWMEQEVFRPAGMTDTRCWGIHEPEYAKRVVHSPSEKDEVTWKASWGWRGATGILSTARDLYRWHQALNRDDYAPPELRHKLQQPQVAVGQGKPQYGFGWFISQGDSKPIMMQHGGNESGLCHSAILRRWPERDDVIVVLTSAPDPNGSPPVRPLADKLQSFILSRADDTGQSSAKEASPADQLKEMQKQYDQTTEALENAEQTPRTPDEKKRLRDQLAKNRRKFAGDFLKFAKGHAQDPSAVDALAWIVQDDGTSAEALEAADILLQRHSADERTAKLARSLVVYVPCPSAEKLIRGMIETGPAKQAPRMRLGLAAYLARKADCVRSLNAEGDRGKGRSQYDPPTLKYLLEADADRLIGEARQLIADSGADGTLAAFAKKVQLEIDQLAVGRTAPEIVGSDIDGRPMRLSEYRGKVAVLKFWATWCGPCMGMVPHDRALVKRLEDKPFALLGIESDEDQPRAKKVIAEKGINWRSWWDGGTREGPIAAAWNVSGLWGWPTIFVLDAHGVIRYKGVREQALDDAVDFLLEELQTTGAKP